MKPTMPRQWMTFLLQITQPGDVVRGPVSPGHYQQSDVFRRQLQS